MFASFSTHTETRELARYQFCVSLTGSNFENLECNGVSDNFTTLRVVPVYAIVANLCAFREYTDVIKQPRFHLDGSNSFFPARGRNPPFLFLFGASSLK